MSNEWRAEDHVLRSVYITKSQDDLLRAYAKEKGMAVNKALVILLQQGVLEMRGDKHRPLHPIDLYFDIAKFLEAGKTDHGS